MLHVKKRNVIDNIQNPLSDSYSLLLLNLHGEAFHVGVFKIKAEVLSAEAQVRRQFGGLGYEMGGEITGQKPTAMKMN